MRQEVVTSIARGLGAVTSRRLGVTLGVWGKPGIGKTHLAAQVLREVPCAGRSVPAVAPVTALLGALSRPQRLPAWAEKQLDRLGCGELSKPETLAATLATVLTDLAPFVLHLEDVPPSPHRLPPLRPAISPPCQASRIPTLPSI